MGDVSQESLSEVLRLEAISDLERHQLEEELAAEEMRLILEVREAERECGECDELVQSLRRQRKELVLPEASEMEAALSAARLQLDQHMIECVAMQTDLDRQTQSHQHRLPIAQLRDEDADCSEERRKLRVMRPADRAKQLHEALVVTRRLEEQARSELIERQKAAEDLEQELKLQRREAGWRLRRELDGMHTGGDGHLDVKRRRPLDAKLRRGLSEWKAEGQHQPVIAAIGSVVAAPSACSTISESRKGGAAASSAEPGDGVAGFASTAHSAPNPTSVRHFSVGGLTSTVTGRPCAPELRAAEDEDDFLYGGRTRRGAVPGLLKVPSKERIEERPTAALEVDIATASRKQHTLRALFAQPRG